MHSVCKRTQVHCCPPRTPLPRPSPSRPYSSDCADVSAYLARQADAFPGGEETDGPGEKQAEGQVPLDSVHLLDAVWDA